MTAPWASNGDPKELKVAYHINNNLQSFEVARVDNFSGKI